MLDVQNYADSVASQASTWNSVGLSVLGSAIQRAEASIDGYCGTSFDDGAVLNEVPSKAWIDWQGWVHIMARTRGPVTNVVSVQYRFRTDTLWRTLTYNSPDDVILPVSVTPPSANSWEAQIWPSSPLTSGAGFGYGNMAGIGEFAPNGVASTDIMFRWNYEGGYFPIPDALNGIACRLAYFYYKLREAPMAKILSAELGVMQFPLNMPPDVKDDLALWRRTTR